MEKLPLNIYEILILFGIFQALVLGITLLLKKENRQANLFLALFLLELAYASFIFFILVFGWYNDYPWLHLFPYGLGFIMGPTFYYYTKSLTAPTFKLSLKQKLIFLLIILDYPHSIYHLIYGRNILHLEIHSFLDRFGAFALIPVIIYLYFSYKTILEYQKGLVHQLSNIDRLTLKWLKNFILICSLLILLFVIYTFINIFIINLDFRQEYVLYLFTTIAILWLGFGGVRLPQIAISNNIISNNKEVNIGSDRWEEHIKLLKLAMERDKLYLFPDLNVRVLEESLGLTAKEISLALNKGLGQNFYEFVNNYRIEEVKKRLIDHKYAHLSILGIAQDSGFNSKATFNRIFKETTGLTPNEFRAQASQ